jgi:pyruvate formate lyase activating enzyme
VRWNVGGEIVGLRGYQAVVSVHRDPLPTNCVADWICPGGNGCGYPVYSHSPGRETGFYNLAVFYGACTFDCLFCQNWHFKDMSSALQPKMTPESVEEMIDPSTSCVCFFGGDPTSFVQHSISVAEITRSRENGIKRMCWETNGSMSGRWARRVGEIALESGGIVKVDLKAFDDRLHVALTNSSNTQTLRNIEMLGSMADKRREVPLLVVSTPMIPGYIDSEEISKIAGFIAEIDPLTPYSLLAFHPSHLMSDLPVTTRKEADRCVKAAREAGLEEVHIGNEWLLR